MSDESSAPSPLSLDAARELLKRRQEGYDASRVQRWRDIRAFDPATQWSQVLELLDLAARHGGPPRTTCGMAEWYRRLMRRDDD